MTFRSAVRGIFFYQIHAHSDNTGLINCLQASVECSSEVKPVEAAASEAAREVETTAGDDADKDDSGARSCQQEEPAHAQAAD